jgi:two-component system response regulator HydG
VAATHRDLHERVSAGAFREDLLYRLDVVSIEIPPLRHRPEDIPALIEHFLERARLKHPQSAVRAFSKAALERLLDHQWPGNVRELEHLVERMVLLGRASEITAEELPRTIGQRSAAPLAFNGEIVSIRDVQSRYAAWVLEATGGRRGLTAEKLGIDIKTLARLLKAESEQEGHDL